MADLPVGRKLFVGIDPGQTGGLGIVDHEGQFVAAYRWDRREPRRLYQILETLAKGNTGNKLCQVHNRLSLFKKTIQVEGYIWSLEIHLNDVYHNTLLTLALAEAEFATAEVTKAIEEWRRESR